MPKKTDFFTDLTNFFAQKYRNQKIESFFEHFDWLYELHFAGKLDDDYLELSLRKLSYSNQHYFFLALHKYLIIKPELNWLNIIHSPREQDKPKTMTKSLKTFLEICLAAKKSISTDSVQENKKNQIIMTIFKDFFPTIIDTNNLEIFRNLVKNCEEIRIKRPFRESLFSLVFSNYMTRVYTLKEENKITDENDIAHPELAPLFHETLETLKLLIGRNCNVNEKGNYEDGILFDALYCNVVFVHELIKVGANVNIKTKSLGRFMEGNKTIELHYQSSPLDIAVNRNCTKTSIELLTHGAISVANDYQIVPPILFVSIANKNILITKFLIIYGSHPLKQDNNGDTALHFALKQDQIEIEIIKILLKNHYPIVPNKKSELPIDIARKKNLTEIVKLFEAQSDFFREFSPTNLPTKPQDILPSKPKNKIFSFRESI